MRSCRSRGKDAVARSVVLLDGLAHHGGQWARTLRRSASVMNARSWRSIQGRAWVGDARRRLFLQRVQILDVVAQRGLQVEPGLPAKVFLRP